MPKIQGIFTPYLDSNKLLNGRHLQGPITASNVSSSGFIYAGGTISSSGAVSASALYVNGTLFEGSTIATGITGSPNITVGHVTASSLTTDSLSVSGSAIITGSLTFNAVAFTNTEVSTITGSNVFGSSTSSTHYFSGSVTSSVGFSGDGANLTGLPSQTDHNFTTTLKNKLDAISESANNYVHPTGSGYNHIPVGGSAGQILKFSSNGNAAWDTEYSYTLPSGSDSDLGGFRTGYSPSASRDYAVEAITSNGSGSRLFVHVPWVDNNDIYSLPSASTNTRGGVKLGYSTNTQAKLYAVQADAEQLYVDVPWLNDTYSIQDGELSEKNFTTALKLKLDNIEDSASNYSLPVATTNDLGGAKIGFSTNEGNKDYAVQLASDKMYVNVPWTDTTYNLADGSTNGLSQENFTSTLKTKLDGIAETTQSTNTTDNVQFAEITASATISSSGAISASVFYLNGVEFTGSSVSGTGSVDLSAVSQSIIPSGSHNLGSSSAKWNEVYATNTFFGGVHEINLETKDIGELPEGTILVHSDKGLVPCTSEGDYLVMGVSSPGTDYPIILGAEPVLIDGPISAGDFVTTSEKPGYGKAVKPSEMYAKNYLGRIIAQALEPSEGGLIKAMIRKM